jgi:hypothetical protein
MHGKGRKNRRFAATSVFDQILEISGPALDCVPQWLDARSARFARGPRIGPEGQQHARDINLTGFARVEEARMTARVRFFHVELAELNNRSEHGTLLRATCIQRGRGHSNIRSWNDSALMEKIQQFRVIGV